jgi:phospholipase C
LSLLPNINHVVVIYQENWSFDSLYGSFPGANGIANAAAQNPTALTQVDRITGQPIAGNPTFSPAYTYDPTTLQNPPPPLDYNDNIDSRFLTDPSQPNSPTAVNSLQPYDLSPFLQPNQTTGDIVHRFWQEQAQIDGGNQDQYISWSDNPGLVMSYFDASNLPEGLLAQQYTMDDNFFHAAFGGSFLNHQFLIAAAAPVYPNAPTSLMPMLDATGKLALDANGQIIHDGKITPTTQQQAGSPFDQNYAINTIFSQNLVPTGTDPKSTGLLPSQNDSNPNDPNRPYIPTIGDRLDDAGVSWKWYSGGWDAALDSSPLNPAHNGVSGTTVDPNFQWHHQPLAFYDNFAPWLPNGQRNPLSAAHLQDETAFFSDLATGNLPAVTFIKPVGENNEHPGYTDLLRGQQHVADIVHAIQNSSAWADTAIIITYDENGGRWDHVSPPNNNGRWGDGTRVPAIVISPYAKQAYVDHTEHDTLSILKTIEEQFQLQPLSPYDANASDLVDDFQNTPQISIGSAYVQPDADNPSQFALIVQGTQGNDQIQITPDGSNVRVQISGSGVSYDHSFTQSISRIEIYGQSGDDNITVDQNVTIPAFIFGGNGNNVITAGGGPSVVVGGAGNNILTGGSGPTILIGGSGHEQLNGGSGAALLIAGTTPFDANLEVLKSLEAEWSRTDESYEEKVAHLNGGATGGQNGSYVLDNTTVQSHGGQDVLNHSTDGGQDLFFANLFGGQTDTVDGIVPGEILIDI